MGNRKVVTNRSLRVVILSKAKDLLFACAAMAACGYVVGCKQAPPMVDKPIDGPTSTTSPAPGNPSTATATHTTAPASTALVPPLPFKLFHQTDTTITLVTDANATDAQITAILWQLRDAAATHSFDKLHIPQKVVDARDPIVWFHVYRGPKCASEKYTNGKLPCGASYHAAGEFTFGGFTNRDRTAGTLLHDENHETVLWDPDKPYTPPAK